MLFALIIVLMFGFAFLVPKLLSNVSGGSNICRVKLSKYALQSEFRYYYLELCNIYPPENNLYDELKINLDRHSSLGVEYFTYYCLNKYDQYLHKSIKINRFNKNGSGYNDWTYFNDNYSTIFAEQFIETAREILSKVDKDEIELLSKYNIYYPFTKSFEVDTMKLFKLPK